MPPKFPWSGPPKPSSSQQNRGPAEDQPRPVRHHALDIADSPLPSGVRAVSSPFVPNVRRAAGITRPVSSSAFTTTTPGSATPLSSKAGNTHTRKQRREQDRRAAPEKALTLFAMRLAVLEKIASNVGTLSFIWATVVLLGGFAITLKEIDFWFVTVILVIEGARIFSRSHELEWQHQDVGVTTLFAWVYERSSDALLRSTRKLVSTLTMRRSEQHQGISDQQTLQQTMANRQLSPRLQQQYDGKGQPGEHHLSRTWSISHVPIFPLLDWILRAKHISRLLYWMQLISACVAIALSVYRLRTRDFNGENEVDTVRNHAAALLIFYSMATFEALVFLLERSYWQFQISAKKILLRVNEMCGLTNDDLGTTRRFFYDVYSQCLTQSVFDGLKMDMVTYALTWLQSDVPGEQLGGLRVLLTFTFKEEVAEETLRSLGVKQGAVERLLEMITWKNPVEHEIRKAAADLLCRMVKYNLYSSRVAAISGSIEGIFSLLTTGTSFAEDDSGAAAVQYTQQGPEELLGRKHIETHIVGLRILKNLAKDPLVCTNIGFTRGLLARLVSFIDTTPAMLRNAVEPEPRILLAKKSLELLNLLASASGSTGKTLREDIARIVYTISNLRVILEHGQAHMLLQGVATEILCSLGMDDDVCLMIGQTGGVMRSLAALLVRERMVGDSKQTGLAQKAGVALALLVLKNRENCLRLLRLKVKQGGVVEQPDGEEEEEAAVGDVRQGGNDERDVAEGLMGMVEDWEVGDLAMTILRSLCAYSEDAQCRRRVARVIMRRVMRLAAGERSGRAQEAAVGLLAATVGEVETVELGRMMEQEGMTAEELAARLARLLERYSHPMPALPRLRRYVVELALALAEHHSATFLPIFYNLRVRVLLHHLADSVSELENYATFSGATGVTRHAVPMSRLLDIAIDRFHRAR